MESKVKQELSFVDEKVKELFKLSMAGKMTPDKIRAILVESMLAAVHDSHIQKELFEGGE